MPAPAPAPAPDRPGPRSVEARARSPKRLSYASPVPDDRLLDGNHSVLTPEYVEFDFVLAGLLSRMLAWLIDTFVILAIVILAAIVITLVGAAAGGFASALFMIAWFLVDWGYFIFLETVWSGQTLGKKALGLRVIQESGVRIGFFHAALRNLARPFDRLPAMFMGMAGPGFYAVGGAVAFFSQSHQRLGDMLAGTVVVRERRLKIPASLARPDIELTLLKDPAFRARVARLSAEEEALIFAAALRREELGMEARLSLFQKLCHRLQDDADFHKPPHLSDEKLVLLVAAALVARSSERKAGAARGKGSRFALQ
ncbi:MAG: RDD family protein [Archangiaceae bacterium]|nr:RDD family protein [Archangiaceae bacterium]